MTVVWLLLMLLSFVVIDVASLASTTIQSFDAREKRKPSIVINSLGAHHQKNNNKLLKLVGSCCGSQKIKIPDPLSTLSPCYYLPSIHHNGS